MVCHFPIRRRIKKDENGAPRIKKHEDNATYNTYLCLNDMFKSKEGGFNV